MIPGVIKWFHDRAATRADAAQDALVTSVAAEAMRPGLRVVRPSVSIWDELNGDRLGIKTKRIRSVIAEVHGAALAAPLRGVR